MSLKQCPLAHICPFYENGTKQKGELSRVQKPCNKFLDYSCEMSCEIQRYLGEVLACDIDKGKDARTP